MDFGTPGYGPMNREYSEGSSETGPARSLEEPIIPISDIGVTVPEGARFGSLIQTATAAIRKGAGSLELSTSMGGGAEPAGAESYGKDAREAIRELARANEVNLVSVHTPVQVGNMSGFDPQRGNFSDETRKMELDEVKKAIRFAAEAAQGGAVVVHTGEFQRPMFDADWNKEGKWKNSFVQYEEEPDKAVYPLVDERTGKVLMEVRKNQTVYRPKWLRADNDYTYVDDEGKSMDIKKGDYVNYEGSKVDLYNRVPEYDKDKGLFKVEPKNWEDFVAEAKERNTVLAKGQGISIEELRLKNPDKYITPEEAFLQAQLEGNIGVARGWAMNYGMNVKHYLEQLKKLKEALSFYKQVEKEVPEDELWRIKQEVGDLTGTRLVPGEKKLPSEIIEDSLWTVRKHIEDAKHMSASQSQQAEEQELMKQHAISIKKYATKRTFDSYAEAGIYAMEETKNNPYVKKDIFIAPENIFPEMGYGSHPQELKGLVVGARQAMADRLVKQYSYSEEEAKKLANKHIKATLDTQHVGMWWKHFKGTPGETYDERKKRFDGWYREQVEDLAKNNIVGYVHLVDSIGGGHHHLPAGQGDLPVKDAILLLKKHGFKGYVNSEGHEEESRFGQGRILVETWKHFGSPISMRAYGVETHAPQMWEGVHQGYFGRTYPPKFIFGAYAPSNDWTLWSQVPME